MNTKRLAAIARVAVCGLAFIVIVSGILDFIDPSIGADDPPPHFTPIASRIQALCVIAYGVLLLLPPRMFSSSPAFWVGVSLRGLACCFLALVTVAIICFQARSVISFAFLLLFPGAVLCIPGALSVWELYHAHTNQRNA